ncbi:MAG: hypothetical protein ACI9SB_002861 [Candidatus Azotimanducaceae bacterium]
MESIQPQYFDHQRRYLPRKGLLALRRCRLWSRLSIGSGMLLFAVGVQSQSLDFSVVDCVIKPSQIVDLGSPAPGVIQRILVEQSDFVTVGQWVAQIDDGVVRDTVERASTGTEISADEQIERQVIRSTLDGFVTNRFKSEGEFVDDQPILRVAQLNPLRVEAIVPMNFAGEIQPGMMAEVSPVMAGSHRRKARVTAVDHVGGSMRGSMGGSTSDTFAVHLEMSNPGFEIPAGLTCDVTFLDSEPTLVADSSLVQIDSAISSATVSATGSPLSGEPQTLQSPRPRDVRDAEPAAVGLVEPETMSADVPKEPVVELAEEPVDEPISQALIELLSAGDSDVIQTTLGASGQRLNYTIGPFASAQTLYDVSDSFLGLDFEVRTELVLEGESYIVLAIAEGSIAEQQLKESGLTEYYYNKKLPYIGRYSLGVFGVKDNAYALAAKAERDGVPAEVLERGLKKTLWWLDLLILQEDIESNVDVLEKIQRMQEKYSLKQ